MALSILISEPNRAWAKEMAHFLEQKSYECDEAHTGKECQLKAYKSKFYAVILDIMTEKHSGFEVLKYLRLTVPSVKVVLTFPNKQSFDDMGFSKQELKKLGASDILIKPYSLETLLQSIEESNVYASWKKMTQASSGDQTQKEQVITESDEKFTWIKVEDFYSGNTTIFDCYIKLSKNKYVKIIHQGDFFEPDRIKKYEEEKKVTHLYFRTADRATYINFINDILERVAALSKVSIEKKVSMAQSVTEKYIEEIYTSGLKPQLIEEGKRICQNVYDIIEQKDSGLLKVLNQYQDYDPTSYSHLFLVSFFSAIICQNLEWATKRTVDIVAMGALLHDIGMLKVPQGLYEFEIDKIPQDKLEVFKSHPFVGAEMLQMYPSITEPVRQIVYQHHEYNNGDGFPNGLSGNKIYPLAKIVTLADSYVNHLFLTHETPLVGLKTFINNKVIISRFDPEVVKSLIKGFIK